MLLFVLFKQKTAYVMLISVWSSDVFSSELGAVDLVGEQQFGEDRSLGQGKARRLEVEQVRPQYFARHQIGGELDAPIVEPDGAGEGLREQGLGGARRAFEQDVSAREQRARDHAGQLGLTEHG